MEFKVSRRAVLQSAAAVAAVTTLGIKPEHVLGAEGDVLKVRMVGDMQVLDPGYMIGGVETSALYACMPRLAVPIHDANGDWAWAPSDFVEKVAQDDDTHISFTLKKGMMWSNNGGEITADDVKFSFERMLASDWSSRWPTLDHVDVKDSHSGVIVLKTPFVATWLLGIASESGAILPKKLTEKLPDGKFTTEFPAQHGPYMMTDWTPKQKLVLKANPDFKGTKPVFAEVQFIDVEDTKAAELAFEGHEVDVTSVTTETAARYKKSMPEHAKLIETPGPFYSWIGMNTDHPLLKDIRVRKAIQRAIDVDSILQGAYAGVSPKAYGAIPIGILGHRDASKYSYNPEEAKALLKEAGVSGLKLEFVTLNQSERIAACQIIQSNLADVGIEITIKPVDSGPFWNLGLESKGDDWKNLQLWIMQYRCSPDPSDPIQWFVKDQVGVWNWERWSDPEFEDLWKKGLQETDSEKRKQIYLRMQEIMEDTGAYVWLTFDPLFYAHSDKNVPGFDPGGEVRPELCKKA
ncbi:ABC transporter substrate-binding protein [Hypericibacter terrae]|uniref:ABC transporter substrate-binding protein n=1 Tax=Hypericibacter terrae TaxID=2602015 RepID=A0A5J6MCG8_9PROT|nr:ABC transporter substrate-binding protein [Hypericibacter terrae]QEX14994.1 ABC transporter substrate-binding protein [Hypericibacter terrae]